MGDLYENKRFDFGKHTAAAIRRFQVSAKTLEVDEIYGQQSYKTMTKLIK